MENCIESLSCNCRNCGRSADYQFESKANTPSGLKNKDEFRYYYYLNGRAEANILAGTFFPHLLLIGVLTTLYLLSTAVAHAEEILCILGAIFTLVHLYRTIRFFIRGFGCYSEELIRGDEELKKLVVHARMIAQFEFFSSFFYSAPAIIYLCTFSGGLTVASYLSMASFFVLGILVSTIKELVLAFADRENRSAHLVHGLALLGMFTLTSAALTGMLGQSMFVAFSFISLSVVAELLWPITIAIAAVVLVAAVYCAMQHLPTEDSTKLLATPTVDNKNSPSKDTQLQMGNVPAVSLSENKTGMFNGSDNRRGSLMDAADVDVESRRGHCCRIC